MEPGHSTYFHMRIASICACGQMPQTWVEISAGGTTLISTEDRPREGGSFCDMDPMLICLICGVRLALVRATSSSPSSGMR